jgi:predicted  nucleic acid-binding Zn-ribbon protein
MNLESLNAKKSAIEASFESLKAEQKTHTDKVAELDVELVKLQGEYRLVEELIDSFKVTKEKK